MQANWQSPYPVSGPTLATLDLPAYGDAAGKETASATRGSLRDRFEYRLIFAVSLLVLFWVGVIERCNPFYWISRQDTHRPSLWEASLRGAHHCATIAFQG